MGTWRIAIGTEDRVERFAAQELARYLEKMTGQRAEVTDAGAEADFVVGAAASAAAGGEVAGRLETLLAGRKAEAFAVVPAGATVAIRGNSPRSTLYAVYRTLEALGCRWVFPGPAGEVVPSTAPFPGVPEIVEEPAFDKRGVVIYRRSTAFEDWVDFAPKVRLNTIALHSLEGALETPTLLADRGLAMDVEVHLFGERLPTGEGEELEEAKAALRRCLEQMPPEIHDLFLWPADVYLHPTPEQAAAGLRMADVTLAFVRQMLAAARELRPQARFAFLAYAGAYAVPQQVAPEPGILLEIAPIHRCFSHAERDARCRVNAEKVRPVIEGLRQRFDPSVTQILGYWLDGSLFGRGHYAERKRQVPQFGRVLQDDLRFYRDLGIRWVTTFAVGLDADYFRTFLSPTVFQYPHLLWDPEGDLSASLADFAAHYLGDADLASCFDLEEQTDPQDFDPEGVRETRRRIDEARYRVQAKLEQTTDETFRLRLTLLAQELEHRGHWCQHLLEQGP